MRPAALALTAIIVLAIAYGEDLTDVSAPISTNTPRTAPTTVSAPRRDSVLTRTAATLGRSSG